MAHAVQNTITDAAEVSSITGHKHEPQVDSPAAEQVDARLHAFEELQKLIKNSSAVSGRNGRPWREWIHEGHKY